MKCFKCGRDNPSDSQFCNGCGMPMSAQSTSTRPRSTTGQQIAIALGALLFLIAIGSNFINSTSPAERPIIGTSSGSQRPANATWHQVTTFKGNGMKQTESFSIPGDEWRISWATQPGKYGDMNFQIYVYNSDGSLKDLAANVIGKDNDSTIIRGKGNYYIQINTAQPYVITVEAKY